MGLTGTRFVCALALGIFVCGSAVAQVTPEQQSAMRANCRSDFMSKCSGVSPGGKDALTCLQKNVETLSPGCKSVVGATLAKPAPAAPAAASSSAPTAPAAARTPPAAPAPAVKVEPPAAPAPTAQPAAKPPAQPRPVTAAKPPTPKVAKPTPPKPAAPAPQTATAPPAPPPASPRPEPNAVDAAVMIRACKLDLVRHCRGAELGEGRKIACLNEHRANLTVRCRTALKVTAPIR